MKPAIATETVDVVGGLPIAKPDWIRVTHRRGEAYQEIHARLKERGLFTVCEEAACPNLDECWGARTATIMILGDTCTRGCRFCNVKTGNPCGMFNADEIASSAEMVGIMNLRYVVITSVDRDDLPDHGSGHFAAVVRAIAAAHPETKVETLVPDFGGIEAHMDTLAAARPFVVAQNMETVRRLTHPVRDIRASYETTLHCLDYYKRKHNLRTKTSLMVGLGESMDELDACMDDLRAVDTDLITFGQYLQPTRHHLRVARYYTPAEFKMLKERAYKKGFSYAASGPLVRSSYRAGDLLDTLDAMDQQ